MTDGQPVSEETDELAVIEDRRVRRVDYCGTTLEVRPLKIGQLPRFTQAARPILEEVWNEVTTGDGKDLSVDLPRIFDWIERYTPQLIEAVAAATDKDPDWIASADVDQFAELVTAVLSVNVDFFVRRLLPKIAANGPAVAEGLERAGRMNGSGLIPSNS